MKIIQNRQRERDLVKKHRARGTLFALASSDPYTRDFMTGDERAYIDAVRGVMSAKRHVQDAEYELEEAREDLARREAEVAAMEHKGKYQ